ncbi:acyclic terpene utilization AtuA family protein [Nocardioides sp. GXQ0305]|uniref:acyclic terpene utilization AtuA family protein n=1 Tax=Nocardioides sp. GXQ0305 TaxID=3423912 RepID=UPI003D7C5386
MNRSALRLGAGAGFAGDRIDPAVALARDAALDHLVFECLGERTVAAGHARRLADPQSGHDPLLATRLRAVLPHTLPGDTTVLTNSGAANPRAAGEVAVRTAKDLGLDCRVAVVTGDEVLDLVRDLDPVVWETGRPLSEEASEIISANAYLGHEPVVQALEEDADLVITGRLADPSLYLGPLVHAFGWEQDDWERLGAGTVVGHLLECAGQLTGGYFADPVTKPVADLARLGFPFAEVAPTGDARLAKLPGTGGRLDRRTCAEQLLYEVADPTAYVTPDVVADFSEVRFTELSGNEVAVSGGRGRTRPEQLKVTVGFRGGWLGEGQISYAGPRALDRARLAGDVVVQRLVEVHGVAESDLNVELVGAGAAFRGRRPPGDPAEVRLRVSAQVADPERAQAIGWEVESLYTNGPAGGGGARRHQQPLVTIRSCVVPRRLVTPVVEVLR